MIPEDVDPFYSGVFFLAGLYALLITLPNTGSTREQVLRQFVDTSMYGMRVHADGAAKH